MSELSKFDQIFDKATEEELDFDTVFSEDDELIDTILAVDEGVEFDGGEKDLVGKVPGEKSTDKDDSHDGMEGTSGNKDTGSLEFDDGTGKGTNGAKSAMATAHEGTDLDELLKEEDDMDDFLGDEAGDDDDDLDMVLGDEGCGSGCKESADDMDELLGLGEGDGCCPKCGKKECKCDMPKHAEGTGESPLKGADDKDLDNILGEEAADDNDLDEVLGERSDGSTIKWFDNLHEGDGTLDKELEDEAQDELDMDEVMKDDTSNMSLEYDADEDEDLIDMVMNDDL